MEASSLLSSRGFSQEQPSETSLCLSGVEVLLLMGMPVDRLPVLSFKDRESWQTGKALHQKNKVLHRMGGNSMSIRALMVAFAILLKALDPEAAQNYLR